MEHYEWVSINAPPNSEGSVSLLHFIVGFVIVSN